jgi:prephenate dehydrogenase
VARIAIIGLGLIGGSLGLALKRANIDGLEIAGFDAEWGVGGRARKRGAIDHEPRGLRATVEGAAIVIIATPISQIPSVLEEIASALGEHAIVTDTASTKADVMRWAEGALPPPVSFVGGHPIAGKEQGGIDNADASLFEGRPWAVIPSVRASEEAVRAVENLVALTGAHAVLVDAAEHDSYLAAVSHLPLIVATALFSLASGSRAWPELAQLAGPGFRDTTRLASTSPDLSHDIALTNRAHLLHWLDRMIEELGRVRATLAGEEADKQLAELFARVQAERDAFLARPPEHPGPARPAADLSARERMAAFLIGEYALRRTKEVQEMIERGERRREGER